MWHYKVMHLYNKDRFGKILSSKDIKETLFIGVKDITNGGEYEKAKYILFNSDERKYLLPFTDIEKVSLPIYPSETKEVAYREKVYSLINKYKEVKYRANKHYSFRELVMNLAERQHSNPLDDYALKFIALATYTRNCFVRVCADRRFGKTSVFMQLELMKNNVKITTPESLPAIFYFLENRVLVIDEMTALNAESVRFIQKFALNACSGVPVLHRSKLPSDSTGKMTYDISNLSVVFCYNMRSELATEDKFFDDVFNEATCDRFMPFLLRGNVLTKYESPADPESVYLTQKEDMIKWAETLEYYIQPENIQKEKHNYQRNIDIGKYNTRWVDTWNTIMDVVDLYSEDNIEFSFWEEYIYSLFRKYIEQESTEKYKKELKKKGGKVYISEPLCLDDFMTVDMVKRYCNLSDVDNIEWHLIKVLNRIPVKDKEEEEFNPLSFKGEVM